MYETNSNRDHKDNGSLETVKKYVQRGIEGTDGNRLKDIFSLDGVIFELARNGGIANSQLRKFYDRFLIIHSKVTLDDKEKTLTELYRLLFIAKYTFNRINKRTNKRYDLVIFLSNSILELEKASGDVTKFKEIMERIKMVFEAWVAYNPTEQSGD